MRRPHVIVRHQGATVRRRAEIVPRSIPQRAPPLNRLPQPVPANAPIPAGHYLDYARTLTPEGGVLIAYKDIDTRWRWHLWRAFAWSLATGFDGWLALYQSPLTGVVLNTLCWLIAAALNFLVIRASIRVDRRIEIRADCLILEGSDVFRRRHMEGAWPELQQKDETTFIFAGIYGTRFVEFGTLRRFDDNDRQPETFAEHVKLAMEQLWSV